MQCTRYAFCKANHDSVRHLCRQPAVSLKQNHMLALTAALISAIAFWRRSAYLLKRFLWSVLNSSFFPPPEVMDTVTLMG
mmetsp:Transcript_21812/g.34194  ORF Transcript_21812/g.34194 Transcript_21812/m.34194 type:complete len:80 (+) Transcript_21812:2411-2650(+)